MHHKTENVALHRFMKITTFANRFDAMSGTLWQSIKIFLSWHVQITLNIIWDVAAYRVAWQSDLEQGVVCELPRNEPLFTTKNVKVTLYELSSYVRKCNFDYLILQGWTKRAWENRRGGQKRKRETHGRGAWKEKTTCWATSTRKRSKIWGRN